MSPNATPAPETVNASLALPAADELHVVGVRVGDAHGERHWRALNPAERAHAEGIVAAPARTLYVVARATLRELLGAYLGRDPAALRFTYGPQGKPALKDDADGLAFNLSHTHALAVFAFARGRRVGIDVERRRPIAQADRILERFFTAPERAAIRELPETARPAAIVALWTRKEAYVKALGDGVWAAMRRPGPDPERWWTTELDVGPDYAAAVVAEGPPGRITRLEWPREAARTETKEPRP